MKRRKNGLWLAGVASLMLALVLTSCGESKKDASATDTGSGNAKGTTTGLTADEIHFGMATPTTGNASSLGLDGQKGAEVFIKWVNDQGGTKGRKWKLTVQDDGFDPQKKIAAVNYLIDQAKVFAVWGDIGSQASAAIPLFEKSGVPYLFPYALDPTIYEPAKPSIFTILQGAGLQEESNGNWIAANYPDVKIGMLYLNSPDGKDALSGIKKSALGKAVVGEQQFERTTTSWKPQLEALRSAGANAVVLHASDAWTAKIVTEMKEMGWDAQVFASTGAVTPAYFKLAGSNADGIHAVSIMAAPDDTSTPGVKQMLDAFAKYEPGYQPGTFALHSWATGLIVKKALENVDGDLSRESLIASLNKLDGVSTGGITGDVSFSKDDHLGVSDVLIVEATGGHWKQVTDWVNPQTAGKAKATN